MRVGAHTSEDCGSLSRSERLCVVDCWLSASVREERDSFIFFLSSTTGSEVSPESSLVVLACFLVDGCCEAAAIHLESIPL